MKTTITCPHCNEVLQYKRCINCTRYKPHYVMCGGKYVRTGDGYCKFPSFKSRKDADYCANWDGDEFAESEAAIALMGAEAPSVTSDAVDDGDAHERGRSYV